MSASFSRGATKWSSSPTTADGSIIGTTYTSSFSIVAITWYCSAGGTPTSSSSTDRYNLLPGTYTLTLRDINWYQFTCTFTIGYVAPVSPSYQRTLSSSDTTFGQLSVTDGLYVAVYSSIATTNYGSVSIYKNMMPGFVLQQTITQPTQVANAKFGSSMAMSGTTLFIGCQYAATPGVYVYNKATGSEVWSQSQLLPVQDAQGASFSLVMAISGTNAVVGGANYAYIYALNNGTWTQTVLIGPLSAPIASTTFCFSLDLVGSTLAVGTNTNVAYIFTFTTTTFTQAYANAFYGANYSGGTIALNDTATSCIIGAALTTQYNYPNGVGAYYQSGMAYVMNKNISTGSWYQPQQLFYGEDISNNYFGSTVCRSGPNIWIGSNKGINVYAFSGSQWQMINRIPLGTPTVMTAGSNFICRRAATGYGVLIMPPSQSLMTVNSTIGNATVVNTNTGSVTVTPSVATPPYTYRWTSTSLPLYPGVVASNVSSATTATLTSLYAGTYTANITDGYGLIVSAPFNVNQMLLTKGNVNSSTAPLASGSTQLSYGQTSLQWDNLILGYLPTSYTQIGTFTLPWDYISSQVTALSINAQCGVYVPNNNPIAVSGNIRFGASTSTIIVPWSCSIQYIGNNTSASAAIVTSFKNAGFVPYQIIPIYANSTSGSPTSAMTWTIQVSYNVAALGSGDIAKSTLQNSSAYTVAWSSSAGSRNVTLDKDLSALSLLQPGSYAVTVTDTAYPSSVLSTTYQIPLSLSTALKSVPYITQSYGMTDSPASGLYTDGTWIVATQPQNAQRQIPYTQYFHTLGAVYIFNTAATVVNNVTQVTGQDGGSGANINLGRSCAVGYNTIMASDQNNIVNIYDYSGSSWPTTPSSATLNLSGSVNAITFVSATTVYVSGYVSSTLNGIFVLSKANGVWSKNNTPVITGTSSDGWGSSLAVDNGYVAVGLPNTSSGGLSQNGAVNIYTIANNVGTLVTQIVAPDAFTNAYWGNKDSMLMANGTLIIASPTWSNPNPVLASCGCVYIYKRTGSTFAFVQQLISGAPTANPTYGFGKYTSLTPTAAYLTVNGNVYSQATDGTYSQIYSSPLTTGPDVVIGSQLIGIKNYYADFYTLPATALTVVPGAVGAGTIGATSIFGGTAPYIVSWTGLTSTTVDAKSNLNPGIYQITVRDSAATFATQSVTYTVINPPPGPTITPGPVTNVRIYGQSTGAIGLATLSVTVQPYTYLWTSSNGGSAISNPTLLEAKSGLSAGSYTFKVTDASNHISTYAYTITQAAQLVLSGGTVSNASQPGRTDGSVSAVTVSGGLAPYIYAWTAPGSTTVINATAGPVNSLSKGTYSLRVTDAAGVVVTSTFSILENQTLALTGGAITNVLVYGNATGSISAVTVTGGTGVFTYSWTNSTGSTTISTPTTNSAKTGLLAGTYTLTATDGRAAVLTKQFIVTQNAAIVITGGVIVNANGAANGSISQVIAVGGVAPYTVAWSQSTGATSVPSPTSLYAKLFLLAGTYTCVITDSVGAVKTLTFTLTNIYVAMALTAGTVSHVTSYSLGNGAITPAIVTGGALPLTYSWSSSGAAPTVVTGITTAGLTNVKAGTYVLTVTDATARYLTQTYTIGQPISLSESHTDITATLATGSITVTALGGLGAYSYAWTKNGVTYAGTTATLSGLSQANYACTVTTSLYSNVISVDIATYMTTTVSSTSIRVAWNAIANCLNYKVFYCLPGTPTVLKTLYVASTAQTFAIINTLQSSTAYLIEVWSTLDNVSYTRSFASTATTLAANSLVFNKVLLQNGTYYDVTKLQDTDTAQMTTLSAKLVNNNFTTGDQALSYATVSNATQTVLATIVQLTYSLQIGTRSIIYLPFDSTNPAPQTLNLILQDGSTSVITYNQSDNTINVVGQKFGAGSKFTLSQQNVQVATA